MRPMWQSWHLIPFLHAGEAQWIGNRNKRRVDAREQHCQSKRLATRRKEPARGAATEYHRRCVGGIHQHAIAPERRGAEIECVDALAVAVRRVDGIGQMGGDARVDQHETDRAAEPTRYQQCDHGRDALRRQGFEQGIRDVVFPRVEVITLSYRAIATVIFLFLVALVTSQLAARMRAGARAAEASAARNSTIAGAAPR